VNPEEWRRAKELIVEVLLAAPERRAKLLADSCSNPALRREIQDLIIGFDPEQSTDVLDVAKARRILSSLDSVDPQDREQFLVTTCGSDSALHRHLDSILRTVRRFQSEESPVRPFEGSSRFELLQELGSGAFGTVYRVWDHEHHAVVALKLLHSRKADVLFRFKREFRALVDIRHSNLVRLYELFSEDGKWFFTMELIEGVPFLDYVRPQGGCRLDRLRSAFRQLTQAVDTLHRARRLHRDLKPANALVDGSGRLVVLDFGLVRELDVAGPDLNQTFAGTPGYMAPELFLRIPASEASDWYAAGVMLFQALTGRFPGEDRAQSDGPEADPRVVQTDAPPDLSDLCRRLLSLNPGERPSAPAILPFVVDRAVVDSQDSEALNPHDEPFVGRARELEALECAFAETRQGRLSVMMVEGPSGMGKTALIRSFLGRLTKTYHELITLTGRCYEFESVPYEGLDALIDELSRYLGGMSASRVEALLSRDAFLLPRLFPVLGRVDAISAVPSRPTLVPDAQELRQRTFAALRELLGRLSDRNPLIVWIDDLQWSDRDSITFLADLCAPPQAPPLLLILSFRSDDTAPNPPLAYLTQVFGDRLLTHAHRVRLQELSEEESADLLSRYTSILPDVRARVIAEASGHPLFLQHLTRFWATRVSAAPDREGKELDLKSVLQSKVKELTPFARRVLEFASIAAQPLPASDLLNAAEDSDELDEPAGILAALVRERLLRFAATGEPRRIEPYHDQIRSATVALLSIEDRRLRHKRLASILAKDPDVEPQLLVTHYREAGDDDAAFAAALRGAVAAERHLAFDRAAMFYETALNTGVPKGNYRGELYFKLAQTLGMAGRGKEAAQAYLNAATYVAIPEQGDAERLAADQLMRSGYIDESLQLFGRIAQSFGIPVPRGPRETVLRIGIARARTRLLLIRGTPQPAPSPECHTLARLELLRSGGAVLNTADPVLAAYFQTRHIVEAFRARHPVHLAIALALESSIRLATGSRRVDKAMTIFREAEELAESAGDANARGLLALIRAYIDYLLRRIPEGIRHADEAITYLREHCVGVAWELTAAYVLKFWFMCWAGYVEDVRDELPRLLKTGAARGDVNMEVSLRLLSYIHYLYLSEDQPREYIKEAAAAVERWSHRGFYLQNYGAMCGDVECLLYLNDHRQARRRLLEDWPRMAGSFILRWRTLRVMALFLRGRVALAGWLATSEPALRREVDDYAKKLRKMKEAWCEPMATALLGGAAAGDGNVRDAASKLEAAGDGFEREHLNAYAAAARHFSGRLQAGQHGRKLMEVAAEFLGSQNVRNPTAFLNMLLPGSASHDSRQKNSA
jgi:tetratricopeptide (TPR) repeat protein